MSDKLIIKNFGPIKDIELELKKVNVFIGEQGTGKSTLAKIFTILNNVRFLSNVNAFVDFLHDYNLFNFLNKSNTYIEYVNSHNYHIIIKGDKVQLNVTSTEMQTIIESYNKLTHKISNIRHTDENLKVVKEVSRDLKIILQLQKYFPSERILISTISNSLFSFLKNNITLPHYIVEFGEQYEIAKQSKELFEFEFLGIKFQSIPQKGDFIILKNRKRIKLSESASGYQSIIPLLIVLSGSNKYSKKDNVIIEEPELNIFPSAQYQLIKYIVDSENRCNSLFITTHSPYILSSINNLVYANVVGSKKPKLTAAVIAKRYWLDPNDISAYMLNKKGKMEDIFDVNTQQILVERIDSVSSIINDEYDRLLNIYLN